MPWPDGLKQAPKALFALRADPRVSWCAHVPASFAVAPDAHRLVVAVHGSSRGVTALRDAFAAHAERHRWVVLAPLFPVGVRGDGEADGYKNLIEGDIRYDTLLLAMADEIGEVLGARFERFGLFGFSGGGQFAHRFAYLHAARLWGAVIGAPGAITRIDDRLGWWLGTRNFAEVFDAPLDLAALRRVPLQLLVGDQDLAELKIPPALAKTLEPLKALGLGDIGRNRVERMHLLLRNYLDHGLDARLHMVPGVGHQGLRCVDAGADFLASIALETGAEP